MTSYTLDEMPCFALYSASRAVSQAYRAVLAEEELTYPQFLVVITLEAEGECSVGRLAELLLLDSGTLSPILKRLETRGMVTRERRQDNQRTVIVSLTPAGRSLHGCVTEAAECIGSSYGLSDLTEVNELLTRLNRITAGMTHLIKSRREEAAVH